MQLLKRLLAATVVLGLLYGVVACSRETAPASSPASSSGVRDAGEKKTPVASPAPAVETAPVPAPVVVMPRPKPAPQKVHIDLFYGAGGPLLGFATDQLAADLRRTFPRATVQVHVFESAAVIGAAAARRKNTLHIGIGHSMGAVALADYARAQKGRPVPLLVSLDPASRLGAPTPVAAGVARFVNLYNSGNFFGGSAVTLSRGFKGRFTQVNTLRDWKRDVGHVGFPADARVTAFVLAQVRAALAEAR